MDNCYTSCSQVGRFSYFYITLPLSAVIMQMKRLFLPLLLLLSSFVYAQTANDVVSHGPYKPINLDPSNIYYGFNEADPLPEYLPILDTLVKIMKENALYEVEIYSYSDGRGNKEYNVGLSQRRALAVMDYLQSKGIARERMTAKGLGSRNIVEYEFTDSGRDNPAGRALNRRTEIRIYAPSNMKRVIMNDGSEFDDDDQTQPIKRELSIPLE